MTTEQPSLPEQSPPHPSNGLRCPRSSFPAVSSTDVPFGNVAVQTAVSRFSPTEQEIPAGSLSTKSVESPEVIVTVSVRVHTSPQPPPPSEPPPFGSWDRSNERLK